MMILPAQAQHLLELKEPTDYEESLRTYDYVTSMEDADDLLGGFARTLIHDDRVLAVFGVWPMWHGVGRAWTILSKEVLGSFGGYRVLHKSVRESLDVIQERERLGRVEAVVRYGHVEGHAWMRHLGFERECLMRNYGFGGNSHFHLYARVRDFQ
jgi:hypothetical protein